MLHFYDKIKYAELIFFAAFFLLQAVMEEPEAVIAAGMILVIVWEGLCLFLIRRVQETAGKSICIKNLVLAVWGIAYLVVSGRADVPVLLIAGLAAVNVAMSLGGLPRKKVTVNYWLLAIVGLFGIVLVQTVLTYVIRHDAFQYYRSAVAFKEFELYGNWLDQFKLCGHISYSYSAFLYLALMLSGLTGCSEAAAIHVVHYLMAAVTVCCIWKITATLKPAFRKYRIAAVTAACVCSPYFLGMFGNISLDYFFMCSLVWFACAEICYKRDERRFPCAWLLVFAKEPAVFVYFGYICLKYAWRALRQLRRKAFSSRALMDMDLVRYLLPAVCFVVKYDMDALKETSWGGNQWIPTNDYYLDKLEQCFIGNFSWVILLIFALALFAGMISGKMRKRIFQPDYLKLYSFMFTFTIVNMLVGTYKLWRYDQPIELLFLLTGLLLLEELLAEKALWGTVVIGGAMAVQSFVSVDPVSALISDRTDIGNGYLYDIDDCNLYDDRIYYNREYTYNDNALEKILQEIGYTGSEVLLCDPATDSNSAYGWLPYWDMVRQEFDNEENENTIRAKFYQNWVNCNCSGKTVYYIDFPFAEEGIGAYFTEEDILSEHFVTYGTCKIGYYEIDSQVLEPPVYQLGETLAFDPDGNGRDYINGDITTGADGKVWIGETVNMACVLSETAGEDLEVQIRFATFAGQPINLYANDTLLGQYTAEEDGTISAEIPGECVGEDGYLKITLECPDSETYMLVDGELEQVSAELTGMRISAAK